MSSAAGKWWRRVAAAMKDTRSIYLSRAAGSVQRAEIETAVIRATSHDERSLDYKNAARVFAWARASPSSLALTLRALSRRATRTRSWAVALKTLLLAHGVLLSATRLGRLPFDLADFRDRSSHGFSAFVRAYFQFLDHRSVLYASVRELKNPNASNRYSHLDTLVKMQDLLDLLMQIRPYADGMEVGLVREAMDCAIIEIFEVYSSICSGIARFLVDVLGPNSSSRITDEEWAPVGMAGMRILRRAAEQSQQLSSYFRICRILGVANAAEIPPVETIPEDDIRDLEDFVRGGIRRIAGNENCPKKGEDDSGGKLKLLNGKWETVVTEEWEVFEEEGAASPVNGNGNPFYCLEDEDIPAALIELI